MRRIFAILGLLSIAFGQGGLSVSSPSPVSVTTALPAGTNLIGTTKLGDGTNTKTLNPCEEQVWSTTPFSLASTTSLKVIANSSGKKTYICSFDITMTGGAGNVALIEGTKTTTDCDTATAGMAGGTTASTGWGFGAQGGMTDRKSVV